MTVVRTPTFHGRNGSRSAKKYLSSVTPIVRASCLFMLIVVMANGPSTAG
jgi:hypothetical protein